MSNKNREYSFTLHEAEGESSYHDDEVMLRAGAVFGEPEIEDLVRDISPLDVARAYRHEAQTLRGACRYKDEENERLRRQLEALQREPTRAAFAQLEEKLRKSQCSLGAANGSVTVLRKKDAERQRLFEAIIATKEFPVAPCSHGNASDECFLCFVGQIKKAMFT